MPVKRDADGNIIEVKTERADPFGREARPDAPTAPRQPTVDRQPARPARDAGLRANVPQQPNQQSGYEADTILVRSKPDSASAQDAPAGVAADTTPERRTRIYRPGARKSQASEQPSEAARPSAASAMDNPLVGWLVIIQGPGQGKVVTIGTGSNSLGRDPDERICVDFGDETISRSGHTTITYDPKGRKFYVQHGGGKNLTYMEDLPVLVPTELQAYSKIQIGETELLFVPLCGERFDWAEYE